MKIFHCDHCQQLVFFENVQCVNCERALAYLPDLADVVSLGPAGNNLWKCVAPRGEGRLYRLCDNYTRHNTCNWAVPQDDPNSFCASCRLTQVIPDLSAPGNKEAWYRLEVAKRRLIYTLLSLNLQITSRTDDPEHGLAFEFLAEPGGNRSNDSAVITGHNEGVITINVAEADDVQREKNRQQLHEPYRTLLGHFRHEVGHYYWDRLIANSDRLDSFRKVFGDERQDYAAALQQHYHQGAPADWQQNFVSAYASSHPWEDWAETWAHYLHMVDALETSTVCGLSLRPRRTDEPSFKADAARTTLKQGNFEQMIDHWFPLTYVLNNLNRGLGLPDGYPFVLSPVAISKLKFVHESATH